MAGSSAMSNIRSPLRMNFAGEVVKDEAIETKDQKAKEKKRLSQKENKSTKEKWFRVVRQTKKKGEQNSNQNQDPLDGFFASIEMFVCGPEATNIEDQKKTKKGRLSNLTIPLKTEKKKNDPKETKKGRRTDKSTSKGDKVWFRRSRKTKKEATDNSSSVSQMISSLIKNEEPAKESKSAWIRLSTKSKQEKKASREDSSTGIDLKPLSDLIAKLVKDKGEHPETQNDLSSNSKPAEAQENEETIDSRLRIWYEKLKSEGEGYVRFVSHCNGSYQDIQANGSMAEEQSEKSKMHQEPASSGTDTDFESDDSCSAASNSSDFSSYEVPSILQEIKSLTQSFRLPNTIDVQDTNQAVNKEQPPIDEDENYLVKIASNRSLRSSDTMEIHPKNTLTLRTCGAGSSDHGFKVELHENRAVCEV